MEPMAGAGFSEHLYFFTAKSWIDSDAALHRRTLFRTVRIGRLWRGTNSGRTAIQNQHSGPALSHHDRSHVCDLSADSNSAQQLSPEYNLGFSRIARRPRDCPGVETTISRTRRFNTSYCSAQQKSEPRHLESGSWPDREPDDRCGHSATDRPHNQLSTH